MEELVEQLEDLLDVPLPEDYREFLIACRCPACDVDYVLLPPRSGVVDELFSVEQIFENYRKDRIGISELSLLQIGDNMMDDRLYLKLGEDGFGEVHFYVDDSFCKPFKSFTAFLAETEHRKTGD